MGVGEALVLGAADVDETDLQVLLVHGLKGQRGNGAQNQYQREQDSGKLLHVFSSTVKILGMRFISLSIVIRQLDAAILNGGDDC